MGIMIQGMMTAATATTPVTWRKTWDRGGKDVSTILIQVRIKSSAAAAVWATTEQEQLFQHYLCATETDTEKGNSRLWD